MNNNHNENRQMKGRPRCNNYYKPGYLKENGWKFHGKPTDWRSSRSGIYNEGRSNATITKEEIILIKLKSFY